jgi:hypothetical protein
MSSTALHILEKMAVSDIPLLLPGLVAHGKARRGAGMISLSFVKNDVSQHCQGCDIQVYYEKLP